MKVVVPCSSRNISLFFHQASALRRLLVAWLFCTAAVSCYCQANVIITEIAEKGTSNACNGGGNDWVEIYNNNNANDDAAAAVNISGWILHDDKGMDDDDAYTFPVDQPLLDVGAYLVLCTRVANSSTSPQFKIGASDTITLVDTTTPNNNVVGVGQQQQQQGVIVSQVQLSGTLDNVDGDVSFALDETDGTFKYTTTPTPGLANIVTPVLSVQERLQAQNAAGTTFFNMDDRGFPVINGMDDVLDLHITMDEVDYQSLMQNASYLRNAPFSSALVVPRKNDNDGGTVAQQQLQEQNPVVLLNLTSPGRIRPAKGQNALTMSLCMNKTPALPFVLEFNRVNASQTLFGVEKLFLRSPHGDSSYMREWVMHRLLARFGLPHLRTRTVRFFINNRKIGLYTTMEAIDQDYVFYRNFPTVDFDQYALYKIKAPSKDCGTYSAEQQAAAQARMGETSTPPYAWQRGNHREQVPILNNEVACQAYYDDNIVAKEMDDAVLAYMRTGTDMSNQNCGDMLINQKLIDRDLGSSEKDPTMSQFINDHLAYQSCQVNKCNYQTSNLANDVDVDNFLKQFAVYAVTMNQDSPMGTGLNYHLADRGDGTGWKIVIFDQNKAGSEACKPEICNPKLVYWSIVRPTCQSLQYNHLVGPILTDPPLHAKYIEYIRTFLNDVSGNGTLVEEVLQLGSAIRDDVAKDAWGEGGLYFEDNFSFDPTLWNKTNRFPLLPLLFMRDAEIRKQLDAIDEGTLRLDTPVPDDEFCADWRSMITSEADENDNADLDSGMSENDTSSAAQNDSRFVQVTAVIVVGLSLVSSFLLC